MKKLLVIIGLSSLFSVILIAQGRSYNNPVIDKSTPDPTVIRAQDGSFYLYATEDIRNCPIYKSDDLVNWTLQGTVFTNSTRPTFEPNGGIWAPDINYVNGQYVMYYSMSVWGGEQTCGVGVATARIPGNNFHDRGKLFRSNEIGVQNSIDPCYIEDNGKHYLFWGSFRGIYCVELTEDGLALKNPSSPTKIQVAGTAFEATYIHKRGDYYYLFASVGSCCEGLNSTYRLVVGRSKSILGPYVNREGKSMLENNFSMIIGNSMRFRGNGHCSQIIQDDRGFDWILFHGWDAENEKNGRVVHLNQIKWDQYDWPYAEGGIPTTTSSKPFFNPTSTKNVTKNSSAIIYQRENKIYFDSCDAASVDIFNIEGGLIKKFKNTNNFNVNMNSGIYIVKVNSGDECFSRKFIF
ncbi:family 43 glycosylhydrolase [Paludibacter sp.]